MFISVAGHRDGTCFVQGKGPNTLLSQTLRQGDYSNTGSVVKELINLQIVDRDFVEGNTKRQWKLYRVFHDLWTLLREVIS